MRNQLHRFALLGAFLLLTVGGVSAQVETPTYMNAQVVSIDPATRTLVISTKGQRESLMFDDLLQSTGGIKTGDRVIVTVRGGPGRRRVSAISLASATPVTTQAPTTVIVARSPSERAKTRDDFARQVAAISEDARALDGSWASFVTTCKVVQPQTMSGGRDWFGLWDGRVQADYSSGFCRDLFNQIVGSGEAVKKSMAAAESTVQGVLEPGEIRDIRRLYNMNWDGWTLPPPARREP